LDSGALGARAAPRRERDQRQRAAKGARGPGLERESLAEQDRLQLEALEHLRKSLRISPQLLRDDMAHSELERLASLARRPVLEAQIQAARRELDWATIRSPIAGRVLRKFAAGPGFYALGEALFEIADSAKAMLQLELPSEQALRLKPGQKATIEPGTPRARPARVHTIRPLGQKILTSLGVEEQRVLVLLRAEEPEKFGPVAPGLGWSIEVEVELEQKSNVLAVPARAIWWTSDGEARVFVVEGSIARARAVQTGLRGAEQVEILAGLRADEKVLIDPPPDLQDGGLLRIEASRESP
jgi:HlyD family secretion protein